MSTYMATVSDRDIVHALAASCVISVEALSEFKNGFKDSLKTQIENDALREDLLRRYTYGYFSDRRNIEPALRNECCKRSLVNIESYNVSTADYFDAVRSTNIAHDEEWLKGCQDFIENFEHVEGLNMRG